MTNESYYLITTSDENTWKFDAPVVFLGTWCCLYDRRHIWQNMDSVLAEPYGLSKEKKDEDYALAKEYKKKLLDILCGHLNNYHKTQHGKRFWEILVGPWLDKYVNMMFNRIKTLEQVFESYPIKGTVVYSDENFSLATNNTLEAIYSFNDDHWNSILYARIINILGLKDITFEVSPAININKFSLNPLSKPNTIIQKIKKFTSNLAQNLARDDDVFIINSYLPKKEEIILQLALGQCPQQWASPASEVSKKPNKAVRDDLVSQVPRNTDDRVLKILIEMLFELLPVSFLEGFHDLNKLIALLPWPKTPKLVFTSNSFANDEVFKLWIATQTELGTKYIVGQHGNNYGTYRYLSSSIEETTADKFLTWGWTNNLPQHKPAFIFTKPAQIKKNYDPQGSLLLIEVHLEYRFTIWDSTFEFANYFNDQQIFVSQLDYKPKRDLTIRLHSGFKSLGWNEDARWKEIDSSLKIDKGGSNINKLISKSRLVVHSYDSTGILETLSQNIPSIAFWQNGLDHLSDTAKPYYELLVDAGIIHLSSESAARMVNVIWTDVDGWWKQNKVQSARKKFCNQFARQSQKPIRDLSKILEF